ncbi:CAF17-like 4Fe-4S cluster assembly/insertion protein YgfZ [Leucobacter japonicus]|uniref:CAF17-like 4Fe-4S cluster assembly/insertion protein YgfZ n=1 Tax=Leucobacter japonicus TaxID=1461259 RepID=UPI0006A7AA00|nr:folate-binding protein YgfZ [Leucobacter japonicus]
MNPFAALPGAITDADSGVARHYGEPLVEQRALDEGKAVVDLSHHGIVLVSGQDRLSWLHSMTSQQLLSLPPGESTETLLLDANGRIERAARVIDDGEHTWLLVDQGSAAPLTEFLQRMRFALRVAVEDVSASHAAVLAFAGDAADAVRALEPEVEWNDPWASVSRGGVQYARSDAPHAGAEWSATHFVFPRDRIDAVTALVRSGTVRAAGSLALDALEVRAWRPSQAGDADERAIPHELDWMRTAVHLTKGCYRGQETVAKVHNLGHPPRRLALLHLDGLAGELPVAGALVFAGSGSANDSAARPVGRVTRAALHYEWGGIALALLKRSVPENAILEVRSGPSGNDASAAAEEPIAATQETIVPPEAGATRDIPRLQRL